MLHVRYILKNICSTFVNSCMRGLSDQSCRLRVKSVPVDIFGILENVYRLFNTIINTIIYIEILV